MKHNIAITIILLCMFFLTQLIGIGVVYSYTPKTTQITLANGTIQEIQIKHALPYNMEPPEDITPKKIFPSILIALVIGISLVFLLTKLKAITFLKIWFFIVVILALGITFNSLSYFFKLPYLQYFVLLAAIPLAFFKIFKRNLFVHNITELMIYPGIAAVFVPILNIWTVVILLLLISGYDMWAVWHTGFMQKLAKFQINQMRIFTGFFIPYLNKKQRALVKKMKKTKSGLKKLKKKKMRVQLAILGGGDIVFPIITAGVILKTLGLMQALFVALGATIALFLLFLYSQKGKFYPAMPFITGGCLVGIALGFLV